MIQRLKEGTSKRSRIKKSFLKKISKQGAEVKREYNEICKIIDNAQIEEYGGIYCTSCGVLCATAKTLVRGWGHSHLLPKGRFPEFVTKIWNISPRCQTWGYRAGCHEALDDRNWEKIQNFKDLDEIMELLADHNKGQYNKFVSGLKSVGVEKYLYLDFEFSK